MKGGEGRKVIEILGRYEVGTCQDRSQGCDAPTSACFRLLLNKQTNVVSGAPCFSVAEYSERLRRSLLPQ
jgi:hypothetical protein